VPAGPVAAGLGFGGLDERIDRLDGFFLITINLISSFNQIKKAFSEGGRTLAELREKTEAVEKLKNSF